MDLNSIVKNVKEKKELSGVDDSIIINLIHKEIGRDDSQERLSKKDEKLLVKRIRAELRKMTGRFSFESEKANKLFEENNIEEILDLHSSTKERKEFYPELNDLILRLKIASILDIGCGVNPLAILARNKNLVYHACDINNNELSVLKKYFERNNISGNVFLCDLRKEIPNQSADLCLILKVFDVIENKGHKRAEEIIKKINSKYILASFSTKTLSGKSMNHPQRGWIEQLLSRLSLKYSILKSKNEIFYLIEK